MVASTVLQLRRGERALDVGLVAYRGNLMMIDMATGSRLFGGLTREERIAGAMGLRIDRALRRERRGR